MTKTYKNRLFCFVSSVFSFVFKTLPSRSDGTPQADAQSDAQSRGRPHGTSLGGGEDFADATCLGRGKEGHHRGTLSTEVFSMSWCVFGFCSFCSVVGSSLKVFLFAFFGLLCVFFVCVRRFYVFWRFFVYLLSNALSFPLSFVLNVWFLLIFVYVSLLWYLFCDEFWRDKRSLDLW